MKYLKVEFDNGKSLDIYPFLDDFSQMWFKEVEKNIHDIWERHRIHGLNDEWTKEKLYDKLFSCARMINHYEPLPESYDLNYLHTFFEKMMQPSYFNKAPSLIQKYIVEFNTLIHHLESFGSKRIVCTFKHRDRYMLEEKMQERFNFNQKPGTVCINYCHVGKPLYDVIADEDDWLGEKIVPQEAWSADFTIIYKHGKHKSFEEDKAAHEWLEQRGRTEKPRSWGLIDVGKTQTTEEELYGVKYIKELSIQVDYEEEYAQQWVQWENMMDLYQTDNG